MRADRRADCSYPPFPVSIWRGLMTLTVNANAKRDLAGVRVGVRR